MNYKQENFIELWSIQQGGNPLDEWMNQWMKHNQENSYVFYLIQQEETLYMLSLAQVAPYNFTCFLE